MPLRAIYGEFKASQSFISKHGLGMGYINGMKRFEAGTSVQAQESRHCAAFFV